MNKDHMKVVVSGTAWVGSGLGSIETALYQLLQQANDEVIIVAYTISGSAADLFSRLGTLLERGIKITILVNRYTQQSPPMRQKLRTLHRAYAHLLSLYSFDPDNPQADLHAKIILVDRKRALVGSANLSTRGLMDNHELDLVVEGPTVHDIVRAINQILRSPFVKAIPVALP